MKLCYCDYTDCLQTIEIAVWLIILVIKSKLNKKARWCFVRHPWKTANLFGLVTLNLCNFVQHKWNTVNTCDGRLQRDTGRVELHSPLKSLWWQEFHFRDKRLPTFSLCERIVFNDKQINGLLRSVDYKKIRNLPEPIRSLQFSNENVFMEIVHFIERIHTRNIVK